MGIFTGGRDRGRDFGSVGSALGKNGPEEGGQGGSDWCLKVQNATPLYVFRDHFRVIQRMPA